MVAQSTENFVAERATVLFSGGTDSTFAAWRVAERVRHVTLLTFDNGFIFFIENSKRHADALRNALGTDRVTHEIIPIKDAIRRILLGRPKEDLKKYGFNLTALVCLGCRMSMHAAALIYNLENGIPIVADGSIMEQSSIPEQLDGFIRANRRRLWERYGIRHYSPIYHEAHSDIRLDEVGVSTTPHLKRQFILYDTQPTCAVGVPADVYAKLFYGEASRDAREVDTFEYSEERYPLIDNLVAARFAGASPALSARIEDLRRATEHLPATWEDLVLG
ncbi:hypothetical protein K8I61_02690 [bacterium]|nr:hypothetical protein [bacterium]